ncbi:MAG: hypothetical protein J5493_05160 [Lachnospiraceae bacterium]|nr:hypothetical protein [Lachnospiraceae bacterium]
MTTGTNFWDHSIWSFVVTLTILLLAMLFAAILRQRFAFIRRFMIPSSVLGGFLILIVGFIVQQITGKPLFDRSLLETLTYHGLGLGFAAMSLRNLDRQSKEYKGDSFRTSLSVVSSYLIQGIIGLLLSLLLFYLIGSFFGSGMILPMGYGQGPGQAYNWGRTYENLYGFEDGTSFGLTVAAMGFIASSIGGIIYLNRMRKQGLLAEREDPQHQAVTPQQIQGDNEIPVSDSIDKLTVQLALVFLSYLLAYLTMRGLNSLIETGVLGKFGVNTLQPLIWGFNFLFSTLFGILVKTVFRLLQKKGVIKQHFTNTFMQDRIAGFMFDVMVVASIAAINLSAFTHAQFVLPLALMCIGGAVLTYIYLNYFCRKLFPDYRHEAFLSLYGMLTGTASTGVILLREADPRFATPAANNLVYQQGYAILFGAPLMLLMGFGAQKPVNAWITLGVMAVMLVILNFIAFHRKKK